MHLENFDFGAATTKFYDALFDEMPGIQTKFQHMESQRAMFEIALRLVLDERRHSEKLRNFVRTLGHRHKNMGIQRMHMRIGRQAFRRALNAGDPTLDEAVVSDYMSVFTMLEEEMGFAPALPSLEASHRCR